jgi:hypothetical protein
MNIIKTVKQWMRFKKMELVEVIQNKDKLLARRDNEIAELKKQMEEMEECNKAAATTIELQAERIERLEAMVVESQAEEDYAAEEAVEALYEDVEEEWYDLNSSQCNEGTEDEVYIKRGSIKQNDRLGYTIYLIMQDVKYGTNKDYVHRFFVNNDEEGEQLFMDLVVILDEIDNVMVNNPYYWMQVKEIISNNIAYRVWSRG